MSGALCYPPCENGTVGIGPVCWGYCPAGMQQCGALCMAPGNTCHEYIANITKDALSIAGNLVEEDYNSALDGASEQVDNFAFPVCSGFNS